SVPFQFLGSAVCTSGCKAGDGSVADHAGNDLLIGYRYPAVRPAYAKAVIKFGVRLGIRSAGIPAPAHNLPDDHLCRKDFLIFRARQTAHTALCAIQEGKIYSVLFRLS